MKKSKALNLWTDDGGYVEAESWLKTNPNKLSFASNHFGQSSEALSFIRRLYKLGARHIIIGGIYSEDWRIAEERGPYADTLYIQLPANKIKIAKIKQEILASEPDELDGGMGDNIVRPNWKNNAIIRLWWD